jgi:AraC-like DNA-binding protein
LRRLKTGLSLDKKNGFDSVLELLSILHDLSISRNMKMLSDPSFTNEKFYYNSRRIEKVFEFMNNNYNKQVSLAEVARIANMPEASFSRFIKKRTGKTFIDSLNEIRLGHASRMLIDSTLPWPRLPINAGLITSPISTGSLSVKSFVSPKSLGKPIPATVYFYLFRFYRLVLTLKKFNKFG